MSFLFPNVSAGPLKYEDFFDHVGPRRTVALVDADQVKFCWCEQSKRAHFYKFSGCGHANIIKTSEQATLLGTQATAPNVLLTSNNNGHI